MTVPSTGNPVFFKGDNVLLAGQIDYPNVSPPSRGYALIFIIQHATSTSLVQYNHIAKMGNRLGMAVFRWDKRGTGGSGSGGGGAILEDTLAAYDAALSQAMIDLSRIVIYAQNEGTMLLSEGFGRFEALQKPLGVILAGNMLDEKQILNIHAPVHIVISKNDWNAWQIYAETASKAHSKQQRQPSSFFVVPNSDRLLMYTNSSTFHKSAETSIEEWLKPLCQLSTSI